MGIQERRAVYEPERRTIFVNLDHPQIAAAKGGGSVDEPTFRRLACEVALTEYAIALAQELAAQDEVAEPAEALFEVAMLSIG